MVFLPSKSRFNPLLHVPKEKINIRGERRHRKECMKSEREGEEEWRLKGTDIEKMGDSILL
jgi:hypothetical protein